MTAMTNQKTRIAGADNVRHALIKVHNLRVRTFIGFNREEREKQQDVIINLEINHLLDSGVLRDDVASALNYKTITKAVIAHVENGRFLLLEKLVSDVLDLCSSDERVHYCRVTIEKPHALRFADSVSVTLEYTNPGTSNPREVLNSRPLNLIGKAT